MRRELRIRNFPPELLKILRVAAAQRGITLRALVIAGLGEWITADPTMAEVLRGLLAGSPAISVGALLQRCASIPEPTERARAIHATAKCIGDLTST